MENKKHCKCGCTHPISASVGELIIEITRNSFNIPDLLPYAMWGTLYANTNYGAVLQSYLPTGITVSSARIGGAVVFTYTSGILVDTITVTSPSIATISYLETIDNLKQNYMASCFMVFNCNSGNTPPFLDNSLIYTLQSGGLFLLKVSADRDKQQQLIIPTTRRQINNSIPNMIEIYLRSEPIKAETVWVHQFPYINQGETPVPVMFQFTVFFSERVDMNAEKTKTLDRILHQ